jgi:PadR family transcriptional regulator AphA
VARTAPELSPGEWAVLAFVADAPTHGFAVAKALAADGEVGRVWTLPRPLVYRALDTLQAASLVEPRRVEQGNGPKRTIVATTRRGRRLVDAWLEQPVEHVRDVRSQLLLKLLFLDRAGRDPSPLLRAQLDELAVLEQALAPKAAQAEGFDRTLALWRLESARAATRALKKLLSAEPSH